MEVIANAKRQVAEAVQTAEGEGSRAGHAEQLAFLTHLEEVLREHGIATTAMCLRLVPVAQAKGDSRAEIDLMLDRYDRGLMANAFLTLNPRHPRFPCEVVGTGRIVPPGLDVPQRQTG